MDEKELKFHTLRIVDYSKDILQLYSRCAILNISRKEILANNWNGNRIRYFFGGRYVSETRQNIALYINRTSSLSNIERINILFISALIIIRQKLQKNEKVTKELYRQIRYQLIKYLPYKFKQEAIKQSEKQQQYLYSNLEEVQPFSLYSQKDILLPIELDTTEKLVIESILNGEGYKEIGDKLGVSYRRIRQILDGVIEN